MHTRTLTTGAVGSTSTPLVSYVATPPALLTAATLREYFNPGVNVRPDTVMLVLDPAGRSTHVLRTAVGQRSIQENYKYRLSATKFQTFFQARLSDKKTQMEKFNLFSI